MAERDDKGRFIKGNKASPGRAPRQVEQRYYDILRSCVTEQDWQAIVLRAVQDAKKGDQAARTWLTNYLIGQPIQKHEFEGEPIVFRVVYKDKK